MSWTRFLQTRILFLAGTRFLLRIPMFPNCANPQCTASFGKLHEGHLFRFKRTQLAGNAPSNSHSVEHAWLCSKCSENYTLEYCDNQTVLVALPAPIVIPEPAPIPISRRRRVSRPIRRPRSRRAAPPSLGGAPVVLVALTPKGDFPDRS